MQGPRELGADEAVALLVGLHLWLLVGGTFCANALLLWARHPSPALAFGCAVALAVTGHVIASRRWLPVGRRSQSLLSVAISLFAVGLSLSLALFFFDISCDGPAYHEPAILQLASGWNPFRDAPLDDAVYENIWSNHYPKASWNVGAAALALLGKIEAGKAQGLILVFASAALVHSAARARQWRPRRSALAAFLLSFNPVCLYQSQSFYVDGLLACAMVSTVAIVLMLRGRPRAFGLLGLLFVVVVYGANLKFTGLVYLGLLLAGSVLALLLERSSSWAALAVSASLALAAAVLVFGNNPYITNWATRGHPFHPLEGPADQRIDVMKSQASDRFLAKNRISKLLIAHLSRATNDTTSDPTLKLPFTVSARELRAFHSTDVRIGGFGPLFALAVLLGLAGAAAHFSSLRGDGVPWTQWLSRGVLLGCLTLLGTILVNPEAWWARYAPQIWWIPCGIGLALLSARSQTARRLGWSVVTVLALNLLLVGGSYFSHQVAETRAIDAQLRALSGERGTVSLLQPQPSAQRRLLEAGLEVRETAVPCGKPIGLHGLPTEICPVP
ncbi:MAG: hypothetical protein QM765_02995 [Myxococcales bacterium]